MYQSFLRTLRHHDLRQHAISSTKQYSALFLAAVFALLFCCAGGPAEAADRKYQRAVETYTIPDVVLINQDGKRVRLRNLLLSGKPIIVDFIFGTCTTVLFCKIAPTA